jgi:hypothetical protein
MDGAVAAAQVDAVAVVQQRGDLIEDIEWKGIQGRGRTGACHCCRHPDVDEGIR